MAPNEKGMIMMACAEKFGAGAVRNILRHNRREIEHSSNHDIDPKRLERDYISCKKRSPQRMSLSEPIKPLLENWNAMLQQFVTHSKR